MPRVRAPPRISTACLDREHVEAVAPLRIAGQDGGAIVGECCHIDAGRRRTLWRSEDTGAGGSTTLGEPKVTDVREGAPLISAQGYQRGEGAAVGHAGRTELGGREAGARRRRWGWRVGRGACAGGCGRWCERGCG